MTRIADRFGALKGSGRKALIPYLTAGDPGPEATVGLMHALVAAGADMLEIGVPFSDPQSDGPVIQDACQRALEKGVTLRHVLDMVATFRADDAGTPIVLMGYTNPVEAMGNEAFAQAASDAGVDGVIMVDLPPEEGEELVAELVQRDIDPIFLVAPTTATERMARICGAARGFVYYVSLKGVTGAATLAHDEIGGKLAEIRSHTDLPIGVGFGIRDAESAARIGVFADGVVVGSAVVSRIAEHGGDPEVLDRELRSFVGSLRTALDQVA